MFLIHVGFCMYEVGASRAKNMLHTLMKKLDDHSLGHRDLVLLRLVPLLGHAVGAWELPGPFDPQGFGAYLLSLGDLDGHQPG